MHTLTYVIGNNVKELMKPFRKYARGMTILDNYTMVKESNGNGYVTHLVNPNGKFNLYDMNNKYRDHLLLDNNKRCTSSVVKDVNWDKMSIMYIEEAKKIWNDVGIPRDAVIPTYSRWKAYNWEGDYDDYISLPYIRDVYKKYKHLPLNLWCYGEYYFISNYAAMMAAPDAVVVKDNWYDVDSYIRTWPTSPYTHWYNFVRSLLLKNRDSNVTVLDCYM